MHLPTLLTLSLTSFLAQSLAIIPRSQAQAQAQPFGIGFSLSIDYGVASIYYPDSSTVDIIKTEGSVHYKALMARAARDSLSFNKSPSHKPHPDLIAPANHQHLLDNTNTNAEEYDSMIDMFDALKIAVEAYLGQEIETANVAIPFPMSRELEDSISAAYSAADLRYASPPQPAGVIATSYAKLGGYCAADPQGYRHPAQLILAVDWNRAAFTLNLLEEHCGLVTWRRIEHDERLGDDGMRRCKAVHGEEKCDEELVDFIRRAIRPLGDEGSPNWVKLMLLVGEYSMSTKIMGLVKQELGKQYDPVEASNPGNKHRGYVHAQPIDPVFAAARAAASNAWAQAVLIDDAAVRENVGEILEL